MPSVFLRPVPRHGVLLGVIAPNVSEVKRSRESMEYPCCGRSLDSGCKAGSPRGMTFKKKASWRMTLKRTQTERGACVPLSFEYRARKLNYKYFHAITLLSPLQMFDAETTP